MAHELPALPYATTALEPRIDAGTMEIHHGKHHKAYVDNLNKALESAPELASKSAADLIRDISAVPEGIRNVVRNNGGGHVNRSFFWTLLTGEGKGQPVGKLAEAIVATFRSWSIPREVPNGWCYAFWIRLGLARRERWRTRSWLDR